MRDLKLAHLEEQLLTQLSDQEDKLRLKAIDYSLHDPLVAKCILYTLAKIYEMRSETA